MGSDQTRIRSEQNQVSVGTTSPTPASSHPTTTLTGATHRVASASISSKTTVNRADILSWLASVKFRVNPWLVFEILSLATDFRRSNTDTKGTNRLFGTVPCRQSLSAFLKNPLEVNPLCCKLYLLRFRLSIEILIQSFIVAYHSFCSRNELILLFCK
jgi:hypothetical protein